MSDLLESLPPRSFPDLVVPLRADGSALASCRSGEDYAHYTAWLSNFLYANEISLSADQISWLQSRNPDPDDVIFVCSDIFGYVLFELEGLNWYFQEGIGPDAYQADMRKYWEDNTPEVNREDFPFEPLTESTFYRLRQEWIEEQAAEQIPNHADIPYRSLISWALRQIADPSERLKKIDWFFTNFDSNASK